MDGTLIYMSHLEAEGTKTSFATFSKYHLKGLHLTPLAPLRPPKGYTFLHALGVLRRSQFKDSRQQVLPSLVALKAYKRPLGEEIAFTSLDLSLSGLDDLDEGDTRARKGSSTCETYLFDLICLKNAASAGPLNT